MVKEGIPKEMSSGQDQAGELVSKCHTQGKSKADVLEEKRASVSG